MAHFYNIQAFFPLKMIFSLFVGKRVDRQNKTLMAFMVLYETLNAATIKIFIILTSKNTVFKYLTLFEFT